MTIFNKLQNKFMPNFSGYLTSNTPIEKPIILSKNIAISSVRMKTNMILCLGTPGSGVKSCFSIPNICQCNGNYVVFDTDGQLYHSTELYMKQQEYSVKVYDPYSLMQIQEDEILRIQENETQSSGLEILEDKTIIYLEDSMWGRAAHACPTVGRLLHNIVKHTTKNELAEPVYFIFGCNTLEEVRFIEEEIATHEVQKSGSNVFYLIGCMGLPLFDKPEQVLKSCDAVIYMDGPTYYSLKRQDEDEFPSYMGLTAQQLKNKPQGYQVVKVQGFPPILDLKNKKIHMI